VSRTFTAGASVAPATREKVLASAKALGYQVNMIARTMNKGSSNFVGVVTAGFDSAFRASLLSPIAHSLSRRGLMPLLMNADDPTQLEQSLHALLSYQIAGVILTSASPPLSVVQHYLDRKIPVAMINRGHELAGAEVVGSDNRAGGYMAAEALLKAVRRAIRIPLTIKIRSGWDTSGRQAVEIARIAQDCGVDAISIHPRSARQLFAGQADWSIIAMVKKSVSIPVIGNGDICSGDDAVKMLSQTGCDAVMIGRAAIGNPYIFTRVLCRLKGESAPVETMDQRFAVMRRYLKNSVHYLGEEKACRMMRSRLGWFAKAMRHSNRFRQAVKHLATEKEGLELIDAYQESLPRGTYP
jgi:nifR3 family TIM-barrel protein